MFWKKKVKVVDESELVLKSILMKKQQDEFSKLKDEFEKTKVKLLADLQQVNREYAECKNKIREQNEADLFLHSAYSLFTCCKSASN